MILRFGDVSKQDFLSPVLVRLLFFVKGNKKMYDVVIIGAGVVGAMAARLFAMHEGTVCILEKESDIAMGATKANSAIIHAGFDAKNGSLKAILNVRGSKMMQKICKDLSVSYKNNGALVIGYSEEDKKALYNLMENGVKNGVKELEIIGRERLLELEPNIADEATCALYAPTSAIVCPYTLAEAAIGNAMDNGAELRLNFEVSQIKKEDGCYTVISKNNESVKTKIVINSAGIYSDKVAKMVKESEVDVHPRRGEYMLLDRECSGVVKHTIFTLPTKLGKGILVSPTVHGNVLIGPTSVDDKDKNDKKTTAEGMSVVAEKSKKMIKNLDLRMVITSFCGLRAAGNTGDFIIEENNGFVNLCGIESPGLSASPAIAEYVFDLLRKKGYKFAEKKDYIKTRTSFVGFKDWDIEKKNEIIKKHPEFGNIICRCEGISEGEILHAIRTNPKPHDLDGVKRRTRAQMGRCQGGFCSPYITSLLAKEIGKDMTKITKNGEGSYIVRNKLKGGKNNA